MCNNVVFHKVFEAVGFKSWSGGVLARLGGFFKAPLANLGQDFSESFRQDGFVLR